METYLAGHPNEHLIAHAPVKSKVIQYMEMTSPQPLAQLNLGKTWDANETQLVDNNIFEDCVTLQFEDRTTMDLPEAKDEDWEN
jgi:hypothetical protein